MKGSHLLVLMLGLLMLWPLAVHAQIYTYVDANGVTVYTDRKPTGSGYQVHNLGCFGACRKGVDWQSTPLMNGKWEAEIRAVSESFGVDSALVRAVIHAESWFQPQAVSRSGAQGLMQLMPATQQRYGVINAFDPLDNITAGVAYLSWLLKEFGGQMDHAIAAYNAGENAVRGHGGIPPYPETREYVRRVNILYRRYRGS